MDNYNGFQQMYQPAGFQSYYQQPVSPQYQPRWQPTVQYTNSPQTTAVPQYQTQNISQSNNSNIFWVQGESGAKSFSNLVPGVPVALWDSEEQVIYIKTIDQNGKPSMTVLDYTERGVESKEKPATQIEYVTQEQFNNLNNEMVTKEQIGALDERLSSINSTMDEKLKGLSNFATKEQVKMFADRMDDLSAQINDIEDRITSFGKPQNNSNSNNRRGNK